MLRHLGFPYRWSKKPVAEQDGSASLPFYARYYATDAAKAGKVAAYVNFTVVYP